MPSRDLEHTFSPTLLNEARANAAGWVTTNSLAILRLPLACPGICRGDRSINIGGLSVGALTILTNGPTANKDVATKVLRAQTWKFGFDLTRLYY